MNDDKILSYLTDLSAHNDREWFRAHKAEYEEANARFEALVGELLRRLGDTDEGLLRREPKELTYKLMRDTRFSADKSPYLPAFRAHLSSGGKQPVPVGYYLMIMPFGRSFSDSLPTPMAMAPEETNTTSWPMFFRSLSALHSCSMRRRFMRPVA